MRVVADSIAVSERFHNFLFQVQEFPSKNREYIYHHIYVNQKCYNYKFPYKKTHLPISISCHDLHDWLIKNTNFSFPSSYQYLQINNLKWNNYYTSYSNNYTFLAVCWWWWLLLQQSIKWSEESRKQIEKISGERSETRRQTYK